MVVAMVILIGHGVVEMVAMAMVVEVE